MTIETTTLLAYSRAEPAVSPSEIPLKPTTCAQASLTPSNAAIHIIVPRLQPSIEGLTPGSACPDISRLESGQESENLPFRSFRSSWFLALRVPYAMSHLTHYVSPV